ncbi:MAG TPA: hypothetical protein VFG03_14280, partial [Telluria sp.]|nr:hypothetical protein [Telluria sp.]
MTIRPTLHLDINANVPAQLDQFGVWGTATAGASVDIVIDGVTVASVIADADSGYSYQAARWPSAGHHEIVAQVHVAGTPTATTAALEIDVTGSIPKAPTVTSAQHPIGYLSGPDPFLYGEAEAGSTVRLWSGSTLLGVARTDEMGFWHTRLVGLADGSYHFTATSTTPAGTSSVSIPWNLSADWHAPAAPVIALNNSIGGAVSGAGATFSGTAEPATLISLSINGIVSGLTVAAPDGHWTTQINLAPGSYRAEASATDDAQNVSTASTSIAFSMVADVARDSSTTAMLAVGASVQGTIEVLGDHDWFKVTLDALTRYQFTLKGAESNGGTLPIGSSGFYEEYLHLWDPQANGGAGAIVADIQNTPGGVPKSLLFAPAHAGTYFLDMGATGITGTYALSAAVLATDDYANDIAHAAALPLNAQLTGRIDYAGDIDQFQLTLRAGVTYTVSYDSGGVDYGTVDRRLALSDGSAVRTSNEGYDWRGTGALALRPSQDGVYTVSMTGGTGDTIPYHITLIATPDDYLAGTATTGRATLGTRVAGTLEVQADADWFQATLGAGQPYLMQALGAHGETLDLRVFDAQGKAVTLGPNTVYGADSTVWRPTTSGSYFFEVSSWSTAGAYTLLVAPATADDHGANAATAGILAPGQSAAGTLEIPGDVDWFKVHLSAGSDYVFNLDSTLDGHTLTFPGQFRLLDNL